MTEVTVKLRTRPQFDDLVNGRVPRFYVAACHRRAGKTVASLQRLIFASLCPPRNHCRYAYIAPYRSQAKNVSWEQLKRYSREAIGSFGKLEINESELWIQFPTGSRIQVFGGDNPDALRGAYLDGAILDEVAQMDERVWGEVVRPMLADRQGWCVFIGTPQGRNAFYRLFDQAQHHEDWGRMILRASESRIINQFELAAAKRSMSPEAYAQEFEVDFAASVRGAYYADLMQQASLEGRITRVPYDPTLPCVTAWDLGMRDATAVVIAQPAPGGAIHVIDFIESAGVGLEWYANELRSKRYQYTQHLAPHDINVKELGTGRTRAEVAAGLGMTMDVVSQHKIPDGIQAVRSLLPRCWFDREKTTRLTEALELYRQEWDGKLQNFKPVPLHDWTSHASDAMRYLAMGNLDLHNLSDWSEPININLGVA